MMTFQFVLAQSLPFRWLNIMELALPEKGSKHEQKLKNK